MAEKLEWVEIIEPRTGEPMYANLKSGQCLWEPPSGVRVRKANDSQWWELYDQKTRRYYYYCAGTQTTVWHKPKDVEIIPLAKLQTLKAREKRRAAKAREEKREGSSRREGSERRRRDGSLRKDGSGKHEDSSGLKRERSGRKDGVSREGSSSRRHGSSREKREQASLREHRKHDAEQASSCNAGADADKDKAVVENGVENKPLKDESDKGADENGIEVAATAELNEVDGESVDKQEPPELPIPELPSPDLPPPDVQDKKDYLTDDEGRLTPSGTLSRDGILDDMCDDHLSPSGTIERARQAVESASRIILANRAASVKKGNKEEDTVFFENGSLKKKGHQRSVDNSLSLKLRAGGMPATTARLVQACAPPSNSESQGSKPRSLRHKRQVSDSVLKDLRRDDDDDDDEEEEMDTKSLGTPSTLPRLSRPSSIASAATGPSKHSTLERSHSIPGSKPPLMRALGAYEDYFSHHKKGVFRRKRISLASMLSWSKVPIKKPLILIQDRQLKKDAIEMFKLILGYMGDRTIKGKTPERLALELTTKGWSTSILRDEIYLQLCKQTTDNFRPESLRCGWELMAICLALFPPSTKFHSYLEGYINKHLEDADWNEFQIPVTQYARHCSLRLKRIARTGAKRGLRKPSVDEIQQAKSSVFHPSMFGATLEDIMEAQAKRFPSLKLPWILPTLAESVLHHQGASTEGIFRVPGDIDEVNSQKLKLDRWEVPTDISDPHVPASLLKLWFRELHEPLIPEQFYEKCVNNCDDQTVAVALVMSLPEVNRLVLSYLIRFLQIFSLPNMSSVTKMDVNNLSMVWAPNCLRCPSDDPKEIFENTRKEMTFMRTLLRSLDASYMEGVR